MTRGGWFVVGAALLTSRAGGSSRSGAAFGAPRRRPWLFVAGVLAMVISAGAFALVYLGSDARTQVLMVVRPVAAGQILSSADLQVVRIVPDAGVDVVSASGASRVIGHGAAVPLTAGSLLASSQVGPAAWPAKGQIVVAVPVKAGRLADGVAAGSTVLVIPIAAQGSVPTSTPGPLPSPIRGTVVAVTAGTDGSGTTVVSLLVPAEQGVTVAGGAGELSLALVAG